jgi:transposase InsO family protein
MTARATAARLGVAVRTLGRWRCGWRRGRLPIRARGRPARHAGRLLREEIMAVFEVLGPRLGLPGLRAMFPQVARSELVDLQRRYRRWWRRRHRRLIHRLTWSRPGTVWAADFSHPPAPIDGILPRLLAVRDLASGMVLEAAPAPGEAACTARAVLDQLVRAHGAPLVLKTDNGSAFIATELKRWATGRKVLQLYSPPVLPAYNGSIEAGIGSLKARIRFRNPEGTPTWSADDVEAARCEANTMARPWGWQGPTPAERWQGRIPLTATERTTCRRQYERLAEKEKRKRQIPAGVTLSHRQQASIDRVAIRRMLTAKGFLFFRRSRISPPVGAQNQARIM